MENGSFIETWPINMEFFDSYVTSYVSLPDGKS